eukprot:10522457-Lingulodinium_polyedra.AAC.1
MPAQMYARNSARVHLRVLVPAPVHVPVNAHARAPAPGRAFVSELPRKTLQTMRQDLPRELRTHVSTPP